MISFSLRNWFVSGLGVVRRSGLSISIAHFAGGIIAQEAGKVKGEIRGGTDRGRNSFKF